VRDNINDSESLARTSDATKLQTLIYDDGELGRGHEMALQ